MPVNTEPREGTAIREIYDLFQGNKGVPIKFTIPRDRRVVDSLIDYYGLDIRCLRRGQWVLAGEWFGRAYVDYLCDHFCSLEGA